MTETLLVMPFFFMSFILLVQICLHHMVGYLADVAAYQAAKSVWLWQPEIEANRATLKQVETRAKVNAAMTMLPIGKSSLSWGRTKFQLFNSHPDLREAEQVARSSSQFIAFLPSFSQLDGGPSFYALLDLGDPSHYIDVKLRDTYISLEKSKAVFKEGKVGFKLVFEYQSLLPFFSLFGSDDDGNITVTREVMLPKQSPPNRNLPDKGVD